MSLFDKNLASKPVKDPDEFGLEDAFWYWYSPDFDWTENYTHSKPHTKFANDKKQKQFRRYASRNVIWKGGRIK